LQATLSDFRNVGFDEAMNIHDERRAHHLRWHGQPEVREDAIRLMTGR
jgi:hypothetical protein